MTVVVQCPLNYSCQEKKKKKTQLLLRHIKINLNTKIKY